METIFITGFVLISQNRQSAHDSKRAELDYEVNVLTYRKLQEIEATLQAITERLDDLESLPRRKSALVLLIDRRSQCVPRAPALPRQPTAPATAGFLAALFMDGPQASRIARMVARPFRHCGQPAMWRSVYQRAMPASAPSASAETSSRICGQGLVSVGSCLNMV